MNQSVRFVLAVVLMIAVVVITNMIFPPAPRNAVAPSDTTTAQPASTAAVQTQAPAPAAVSPAAPTPAGTPADTIVVASPLYRYGFSTRGAALVSAELLSFKSY